MNIADLNKRFTKNTSKQLKKQINEFTLKRKDCCIICITFNKIIVENVKFME